MNMFNGHDVLYGGQSVHGSPSSTVSSLPNVTPDTSKYTSSIKIQSSSSSGNV